MRRPLPRTDRRPPPVVRDVLSFAALSVFVAAVVWFAATAGQRVALWRLGSGQ